MTSRDLITSIFDPKLEYYASVASDTRIELFSVADNTKLQSLIEKLDSPKSCTSLHWHIPADTTQHDLGSIAVGSSNGSIVIWSLKRGVISKVIAQDNQLDPIVGVEFIDNGSHLLVATKKNVIKYDVQSGKEIKSYSSDDDKQLNVLSLHPSGKAFAIAGETIKFSDLLSGRQISKFRSLNLHSFDLLNFSPCGRFLLASKSQQSIIEVFDCRTRKLLLSLTSSGKIHGLTSQTKDRNEIIRLDIVVWKSNGVIEIFRRMVVGQSVEQANTQSDGTINTDDQQAPQNVAFTGECTLIVAHGAIQSPHFQVIKYVNDNFTIIKQTTIHSPPLQTAQSKKRSLAEMNTESTDEPISEEKTSTEQPPSKKQKTKKSKEEQQEKSKKEEKKTDEKVKKNVPKSELTMEQRLEALKTQAAAKVHISNKNKEKAPMVGSMVTVFDQALQVGDDSIIENCLYTMKYKSILETVTHLHPNQIIKLFVMLLVRFDSSPSKTEQLIGWIRVLLREHTRLLMNTSGIDRQVEIFRQLLGRRMSNYLKYQYTSARLDQILSCESTQKKSTNTASNIKTKIFVFVEPGAKQKGIPAPAREKASMKNVKKRKFVPKKKSKLVAITKSNKKKKH